MSWTELLTEPRRVTGVYCGTPSLKDFLIEKVIIETSRVIIHGDFKAPPSPLPKRWAENGYTHASARISASGVVILNMSGGPRTGVDRNNCLVGNSVNLCIEESGDTWSPKEGLVFPYKILSCESSFMTFNFICEHIDVTVEGYGPSAV
ncbi:hypothetical protein [Shewanella woodyi]|uniref:Uncharacterized protein n=1 Tax=Shewanella woodyi (strain ATCC 51908 / MS32) TaxID=392500 RepID=B1KRN7_SHEWM|nr:hypothetical protein [Shewanella woodyi]ACA87802.1 hypothetical protein Swoo_3538 [Shewanella woodyi ATCC 51908]